MSVFIKILLLLLFINDCRDISTITVIITVDITESKHVTTNIIVSIISTICRRSMLLMRDITY